MMRKPGRALSLTLTAVTAITAILSTVAMNMEQKKAEEKKQAAAREARAEIESRQAYFDDIASSLRKGSLPFRAAGALFSIDLAQANEPGDASCNQIGQAAWSSCNAKFTDYQHGALGYFNNSLCVLNKGFPSAVETTLCHFAKSMGINPDKSALPQTISKVFGTKTIVVTVEVPTEAFATAAGYDAKGTVTEDGSTLMVIYWGGSGTSSKGFLIDGAGASGSMIGGKRASYIHWDLTVETQTIKVLVSEFASGTYLSSAAASAGAARGDSALYGRASYNKTTNEISTQMVFIQEQRSGGTAGSFGCFKMYAAGTKGGTMVIAKTKNSLSGPGHATGSTTKNLTDMDGMSGVDSTSTANGTGNYSGASDAAIQANVEAGLGITANANVFDKSCSDVYNAGGSGGAFSTASSVASFTASPSSVF